MLKLDTLTYEIETRALAPGPGSPSEARIDSPGPSHLPQYTDAVVVSNRYAVPVTNQLHHLPSVIYWEGLECMGGQGKL